MGLRMYRFDHAKRMCSGEHLQPQLSSRTPQSLRQDGLRMGMKSCGDLVNYQQSTRVIGPFTLQPFERRQRCRYGAQAILAERDAFDAVRIGRVLRGLLCTFYALCRYASGATCNIRTYHLIDKIAYKFLVLGIDPFIKCRANPTWIALSSPMGSIRVIPR